MDQARTHDTRKAGWLVALILVVVFATVGSCDFFGALQDPADPNSPNYQGYIVVDSPSKVVPMAPKGELNHPPTLYSAKLLGGISYRFQICSDESFVSPEFEKEQSTNIFTPADWVPSLGAGSYRFRVQAKKDTTWGPWSANQIFTIAAKGNVATPTFSIPTGSYAASQQVTITSATAGSLIRYTTDGTNPSVTNGTLYSAPVQISTSLTLKAIAYRPGWQTSEIASASYTVNGAVLPPYFSPNGGTYTSARNVNISSDTEGSSIRYTTDGSTPTETTGTLYTTTVAINTTSTLKAIAYKSGWTASTVTTAEYIITGTIATPTISPAGGIYTSPQQVTITSTLEGASIRYTIDGSTPSSTTGIQYSGPFTVASSCTVRAIAFKTDWLDSGVASAEFTITGTTSVPSFSPSTGVYTSPQMVSLSTTPSDATIRYTTDGTTPTETVGTIYSGPFQVTSTKTIKAIAYKTGWATSLVASGTYTITGTVATPTFSLTAGTYTENQIVTINCSLQGSSIRYTTDGTNPSSTSGALYTDPIPVTSSMTLKAIAYKTDWDNSSIASAVYVITGSIPSPTFSPGAGTYTSTRNVTISCALEGASIRYTTDGSTPSESTGTLYESTVPINSSKILKAIAYKAGWTTSAVSTASYVITGIVPSPTFSPVAGTYTSSRNITISCDLADASIRYTTDGSTPTSSYGTLYSAPVTISSTQTLKAVAYKTDWADSAVGSATYTITGAVSNPTFSISGGTYNTNQSVTLACTLSGASIRYTTDGSTPSSNSGSLYSSPITIDKTTTLKAIAYKPDWDNSQVAQATYTMVVPVPIFNPTTGTYTATQNITISCALEGASIRYTTDGSTPSRTNGTIYSSPFPINASTTLKAIAYKQDWLESVIVSSSYIINRETQSYFTDFSTTPDWETNNSNRYFWDSSISAYSTTNYTNSGDWATKSIYYNGGSFTYSVDIKPTDRDTGDVCFGLYDDNKNSNSTYGEKVYVLLGGYSPVVYLYSISKTGNNCVSAEGTMVPNEWHNITVKYNDILKNIDILVKRNGVNVLSWNGNVVDGFSSNLKYLGISMNGSWSNSGRYEKAIIDNVSFSPSDNSAIVSDPTFSLSEGNYTSPQQITLSTSPADATIRYTIDGSNPSETAGTIYSGPFQISNSTTIKAIAYKTGWITSQVASGTYTVNLNYLVTFNSQSATVNANPSTKTVTPPATTIDALPSNPTRVEYTFEGWWTGVDGTGTAFTASTTVTENITVYAKWHKNSNGCVAYFPFNGNANDESGNGNNGIIHGATLATDRFGNVNKAFSFNGTDNYIIISDSSTLHLGSFTIQLWIKTTTTNTSTILVKQKTFGSDYYGINLTGTSLPPNPIGSVEVSTRGRTSSDCPSCVSLLKTVNDNQWHSITFTRDYQNQVKLYIDGSLNNVLSDISIGYVDNDGNLTIGAGKDGALWYFSGLIDDVRIYNLVLADSEIQSLFHDGGWQ